ncbi:hypothetical protein CONLIGDRAFT_663373 [Coniochaeta ligniaria NRRL 30616]|uniref:Zn(2)-C6 fungal-type domain-containing protein n=1 Tax=Coniochaeta ligniaria NRRL 30616 TaxID=1408157 RepID=A0A1J7IE11_9PEZI|nr:hypothetical protein CONLIGDRAFT_663373 [Coniochaeta ligniaria NRRL 30616]
MDEEQHARKRVRVSVACQKCRNRKSRCDGRYPSCKRCEELGTDCIYTQPESGPTHHRSNISSEVLSRLYALEAKVQSLTPASESQADTIRAATESDTPTRVVNNDPNTTRTTYEVESAPSISGLATPPRDSGPMDGMGEVHLTEATEDSTYFGTSSNAAFIRQLSSGSGSQGGEASKRRDIPSKRPRSHDIVAASRTTNLIHHYFNTLGLFFPCIHPDAFLATYRQLRENGFVGARRLWLALLYMMIASVYQCESPSSPTDLTAEISESYFQWATELAMPEMLISSNLETVQLLCLMIAYLHGSSQSAQLWTLHCLTVKAAVQIGLHSTHASKGQTLLEREMRRRTWCWCIINDEQVARIVSVKLGRPITISKSLRNLVDLPVDINDIFPIMHSTRTVIAASLSAYRCEIQLSSIACDVLSHLYGDNAGVEDDLSIFDTLRLGFDFSWKLSEWQQSVPEELRPRNVTGAAAHQPAKSPSIESQRFQAVMGLRYHGLCALVQRPVVLKFLGFDSDHDDDAAGQMNLLRDSGVAALRRCIRSCRECIALAKAIVDHWQDHRVLLSGAWWLTAYHAFGTSLTLFGISLVSTKSGFSDLLSADEIKTIRSSLRDAGELLSRYNDTLVISRCHECLENFLHLYDLIDPIRPGQGGENGPGFGALATGVFHDARYGFASFDVDSFNRPGMPEFGNFDWGGSLG